MWAPLSPLSSMQDDLVPCQPKKRKGLETIPLYQVMLTLLSRMSVCLFFSWTERSEVAWMHAHVISKEEALTLRLSCYLSKI